MVGVSHPMCIEVEQTLRELSEVELKPEMFGQAIETWLCFTWLCYVEFVVYNSKSNGEQRLKELSSTPPFGKQRQGGVGGTIRPTNLIGHSRKLVDRHNLDFSNSH